MGHQSFGRLVACAVISFTFLISTASAFAPHSVDVRAPNGSKSVVMGPNESVTLSVYFLRGDAAANGVGGFYVGLRSYNERFFNGSPSSLAWTTAPSPTDTVLNATSATNLANSSILDLDFANGSAADIANSSDSADTDTDWIAMRGTQSAANGWDPTYGKVTELLLGTITFTSNSFSQAGAAGALAHEVDVGAYYNGSGDTGGTKVYTLNSSSTSSNSVGLDLLTGVFGNYAPVHVTVLAPEPAAVAALGLCVALVSLRRSRCGRS